MRLRDYFRSTQFSRCSLVNVFPFGLFLLSKLQIMIFEPNLNKTKCSAQIFVKVGLRTLSGHTACWDCVQVRFRVFIYYLWCCCCSISVDFLTMIYYVWTSELYSSTSIHQGTISTLQWKYYSYQMHSVLVTNWYWIYEERNYFKSKTSKTMN